MKTIIAMMVLFLQVSEITTIQVSVPRKDDSKDPNPEIATLVKQLLKRMDNVEVRVEGLDGKLKEGITKSRKKEQKMVKDISQIRNETQEKLSELEKKYNYTIEEKSRNTNASLAQLLMRHEYEEKYKKIHICTNTPRE